MPILSRCLLHTHNGVQAVKSVSIEAQLIWTIATQEKHIPMPWRELRVKSCPANDAHGVASPVREHERTVVAFIEALVLYDTLRVVISGTSESRHSWARTSVIASRPPAPV